MATVGQGRLYRRYAWVMVIAAYLIMAVGGVLYTRYVQQQSDRRLCGMWSLLDEQYQAHPPTTQAGTDFALIIHNLRHEYGCKSTTK